MFELEWPVRYLLPMIVPFLIGTTFFLAAAIGIKVLADWYLGGSTPTSTGGFSTKDGARLAKDADRVLRQRSRLKARVEKGQRQH